MLINTSVLSIYERLDMVLVHLSGGQQRARNPDYAGPPVRRPDNMLAPELDARGKLATTLLISDTLHRAALACNFSGCEDLIGGEKIPRQLLLCHRISTEFKQCLDLTTTFFAKLASGRTGYQTNFPHAHTGHDFPVFAHLDLMLGEHHPDFGQMIDRGIRRASGCHTEKIIGAMIIDSGFTLTIAPNNPAALADHWETDDYWLAHNGKGGDMRIAQVTQIAGPMHRLNHKGFAEPKDFRILRIYTGAVNIPRFLPDWHGGGD
jgi:hypothetical protein